MTTYGHNDRSLTVSSSVSIAWGRHPCDGRVVLCQSTRFLPHPSNTRATPNSKSLHLPAGVARFL